MDKEKMVYSLKMIEFLAVENEKISLILLYK